MLKTFHLLVIFAALLISSCTGSPAELTPTADGISLPTSATQAAIATSITVAPDWRGIPIMPGAYAGEGDVDGYVFTISGTTDQVRTYYEAELPKLGWESMPTGDKATLLFMKNGGTDSLMINILEKDGQVLVLLTK